MLKEHQDNSISNHIYRQQNRLWEAHTNTCSKLVFMSRNDRWSLFRTAGSKKKKKKKKNWNIKMSFSLIKKKKNPLWPDRCYLQSPGAHLNRYRQCQHQGLGRFFKQKLCTPARILYKCASISLLMALLNSGIFISVPADFSSISTDCTLPSTISNATLTSLGALIHLQQHLQLVLTAKTKTNKNLE